MFISNKHINSTLATGKHLLSSVFLFLLFTAHVTAQHKTAVQIPAATDTATIISLIEKGADLSDKIPDQAFQYLTSALEKSRATNYRQGIALASAKLGRWYFGNDIAISIRLAKEALELFDARQGITNEIADMHLLLAEAYDENGKKDSSAYYYYLLGTEMDAGNLNNPEFEERVFTKLAIFWINLDYDHLNPEYRKTVKRFVEKAYEASGKIKDTADGRSSVLFIQGAYHHSIKEYDSARYYYNTYLVEREKLHKLNLSRKISTLHNISETYLLENNTKEALHYISIIKEIGNDPQNTKYVAFYMSFIDLLAAEAYFKQKDYRTCIAILDTALPKLELTGPHLRIEVVKAYQLYASSYEALGDYKKALEYKNTYVMLNDSLIQKNKLEMIGRLEIRNRISEKDKELALQKLALSEVNNKVKDQNSWIAGILLVALSCVIIFALWRTQNIHKQKLQQEKIDNLQQKIKIERLNASIFGEERERTRIGRELHDGIGGLLSVARMNFELAKKRKGNEDNPDFNDGLKLLEEATVELRKAAYNLMPEVLLNQGLASAVQAYCEKMASKGTTRINFQSIGTRTATTSAFDLPVYRIIQELVHNIVKHANASHALVQLHFQEDGSMNITIEDNGIGLSKDAFEKSMSMGLKNTKERVNDLGGKLDIQSSPETGTSIYLEFDSLQEKTNII